MSQSVIVLRELDLFIPEEALDRMVCDLATATGWTFTYHTHDSRRSESGFPDRVFLKPPRVVFAELKAEKGRIRPKQREWLAALAQCHVEVYLWRPSDWPIIVYTLGGPLVYQDAFGRPYSREEHTRGHQP